MAAAAYMLRNARLSDAMANFNQFQADQDWGPKRRLRCAIDCSVKLMNFQAVMKLRFGRIARSLKRTNLW